MQGYKAILLHYLSEGGEADLELAYEFGRHAMEKGFSLLQVIDAHSEVVQEILLKNANVNVNSETFCQRGSDLLKEALAPFEMTRLGYSDTINLLRSQNQELKGLMAERAKLLEQREDFMMVVTHDLKTPVTAADRCLSFLLEGDFGQLTTDQAEMLAAMKDSNRLMFGMIKNLLEVYRYDQTSPALQVEDIDLRELVDSLIQEFGFSARMRKIKLESAVSDAQLNSIQGDAIALRHVLVNLLDNAFKFTPAGGVVALSTRNSDTGILIEVRDTGTGISKDDMDNLFQRFFQADSGRRKKTGMGLGLYLCQQIVQAHGWALECSSEIGIGTTFTIRLTSKPAQGQAQV